MSSGPHGDHARLGWRELPHGDRADAAPLERLSLGSWGSALDWVGLGNLRGLNWGLGFQRLNFHLSWRLGLGDLKLGLHLRLSFDWLRLGGRVRFGRRGLRLNLELSLRLKRLRQGRGLWLELGGLLFGSR